MNGVKPTSVIGAKSRSKLYGSLEYRLMLIVSPTCAIRSV